jgi:hypothetical protein
VADIGSDKYVEGKGNISAHYFGKKKCSSNIDQLRIVSSVISLVPVMLGTKTQLTQLVAYHRKT